MGRRTSRQCERRRRRAARRVREVGRCTNRHSRANRGDDGIARRDSLLVIALLLAVAMASGAPSKPALIELGRLLFFDPRLSANRTQSCASCHQPELAYTDARRVAIGSTGEHHTRNVPTLTNIGARGIDLERQAMRPMLRTHPIELGALGHERERLSRLATLAAYPALLPPALPSTVRRFT